MIGMEILLIEQWYFWKHDNLLYITKLTETRTIKLAQIIILEYWKILILAAVKWPREVSVLLLLLLLPPHHRNLSLHCRSYGKIKILEMLCSMNYEFNISHGGPLPFSHVQGGILSRVWDTGMDGEVDRCWWERWVLRVATGLHCWRHTMGGAWIQTWGSSSNFVAK